MNSLNFPLFLTSFILLKDDWSFKMYSKNPWNSLLIKFVLLIGFYLMINNGDVYAVQGENSQHFLVHESKLEQSKSSWAFAFDNDILVPGSRDQDYTYGMNISYIGKLADQHWASLHEPLDWINRKLELDGLVRSAFGSSKIEYGLFGFTPEDIGAATARLDDRPYASLVYVSSTREAYQPFRDVSWQSTLTFGILGLNIVGDIQNEVHSVLNGDKVMGWDNQISDGGEPTARYSLSRQSLLYKSGAGTEIKSTFQGSVGYITEASWSLSVRTGEILSPWVSFNPELTSYAEKSIPNAISRVSEHYFWTGASVKYRAYNAFLEGQFKNSVVTYDDNEINRGIFEAWMGYTMALANGYSFTYTIRGHTSEINRGIGDRNVIWGGILISKSIG